MKAQTALETAKSYFADGTNGIKMCIVKCKCELVNHNKEYFTEALPALCIEEGHPIFVVQIGTVRFATTDSNLRPLQIDTEGRWDWEIVKIDTRKIVSDAGVEWHQSDGWD